MLIPSAPEKEIRTYEELASDAGRNDASWLTVLTRGFPVPGHSAVPMTGPSPWRDLKTASTAWANAVHGWDPVGPLLAEHSRSGNDRCLIAAESWTRMWVDRFGDPSGTDDELAWRGETVGKRAYRLAYIVQASEDDASLGSALRVHASWMGDFQHMPEDPRDVAVLAAGQLAMATRLVGWPLMRAHCAQARLRIASVLERLCARDGLAPGVSPWSLHATLALVARLEALGLLEEQGLRDQLRRAVAAFAAFALPDGTVANLRDTRSGVSVDESLWSLIAREPADDLQPFADSGYVVVRSREQARGSCAILVGDPRVGEPPHDDLLSIVWYADRQPILLDAGHRSADVAPPGAATWFEQPGDAYLRSARAHNTVEIGAHGRPLATVEGRSSAITRWTHSDATSAAEAVARFGNVVSRRVLVAVPDRWLIVIDSLIDPGSTRHDFAQLFHLHPRFNARTRDGAVVGEEPAGQTLHIVPLIDADVLTPTYGRTEPEMQGWFATPTDELAPLWAVGFRHADTAGCIFATLLWLGEEPPTAGKGCRVNATARKGQLVWKAGPEHWRLEFDGSDEARPISLKISSTSV